MTKLRLDELKAALEQKRPPAAKSEADYKRELVAEINRLPGGRARRIEDRYGTGILDLIIKLPDMPLVMAEGKLIDGLQFAPTGAQFEEGKRWEAAGIKCVLIGWKKGQMFLSSWVEKAHVDDCFTALGLSDAQRPDGVSAVKLCIHCKWYGGIKASTGAYICKEPRNKFTHPVDGLETRYDASWLRMSPELQLTGCGMDAKWWEMKLDG